MYLSELYADLELINSLTEEQACIKFNVDTKDEIKEMILDEISVIESMEKEKINFTPHIGEVYGYDYY